MHRHIACDETGHTSGGVPEVLRSADDEYSKNVLH